MSQEDYLWTAVRILGFYLIFRALAAAIGFISGIPMLFSIEEEAHRYRQLHFLTSDVLELLVFGWLGRYLVLDGSRLVSWALRHQRSTASTKPSEPAG